MPTFSSNTLAITQTTARRTNSSTQAPNIGLRVLSKSISTQGSG
jgi:hypothetical protein